MRYGLLGRELGLHPDFVERHPFPGPGLAIRCPGEITKPRLDILREADAVYLDQIKKHGLYNDIWQAFAVLLPVQTVGVMGDSRTYDFVLALRAVTSTDGMTADYYPIAMSFSGKRPHGLSMRFVVLTASSMMLLPSLQERLSGSKLTGLTFSPIIT